MNLGGSGKTAGISGIAATSSNDASTTKSGISAGSVVITDDVAQQALTGTGGHMKNKAEARPLQASVFEEIKGKARQDLVNMQVQSQALAYQSETTSGNRKAALKTAAELPPVSGDAYDDKAKDVGEGMVAFVTDQVASAGRGAENLYNILADGTSPAFDLPSNPNGPGAGPTAGAVVVPMPCRVGGPTCVLQQSILKECDLARPRPGQPARRTGC